MLKKVVSGGQTGCDVLGLAAAKAKGIPTGGMAPKGYRTEDGPALWLREEYGLIEAPYSDYGYRTTYNLVNSDATVLFGDITSPGTASTKKQCICLGKPYKENPAPQELADWIEDKGIQVLNVAGNRGSKLDETQKITISNTLTRAFSLLGY